MVADPPRGGDALRQARHRLGLHAGLHAHRRLARRAADAWNSGEVRQGSGHLNQPYGSHANRTWHKLAENAIATLKHWTAIHEIAEAEGIEVTDEAPEPPIEPHDEATGPKPSMRSEIAAGLRYVGGHRWLRSIAATVAAVSVILLP